MDPRTPTTLYAASTAAGRVYKSTDGGGTWNTFGTALPELPVLTLAIDPVTPSRLYAGTHGGGVVAIDQFSTCVGDCTGDGQVSVDKLITMVNIALGTTAIVECGSGDANHDSAITVEEILAAVNVALNGCGGG